MSHDSTPHLDAILAHPFSITAPSMHKHKHRGAALTGCPQPSGCQSSQAVLLADCCSSTCNRHHTTAHQRHMPALPTSMQSLHAPSASLHHACTSTHREGQHLQVAPNLEVAKALRQCCQLIVAQVPATVTAPSPISVTCQPSPPRCNPCTPLQHHCTRHAQAHTERGSTYRSRPTLRLPKLSGSVAS